MAVNQRDVTGDSLHSETILHHRSTSIILFSHQEKVIQRVQGHTACSKVQQSRFPFQLRMQGHAKNIQEVLTKTMTKIEVRAIVNCLKY